MQIGPGLDLTYCTNIHPANGWPAVEANLREYAPQLKARLSPDAPFGLGLRLSAAEARELLEGTRLDEFQAFLAAEGLYVALLNGYPYGAFHGEPVKAAVFAPDWRHRARLDYTLDLARILARLLPEGMDGGLSTLPLSYKPWGLDGCDAVIDNLVQVCRALVQIREKTGRDIHLDIEPEPDGWLETTAETIAFFQDKLLTSGAPELGERIAVCFDTCHFAVEYEDPVRALARLQAAGIRIGRIQISAAVEARAAAAAELRGLDEPVYLHQVVERSGDGALRRYRDLPDSFHDGANERRVHFHVPLFASRFGELASTSHEILPVLAATPPTSHLEIETYTWSVLPEGLRVGLADSIEREYRWVLDSLCTKPSS